MCSYFGKKRKEIKRAILSVGTDCLWSTVETVWTGPMAQWPNPKTLTGPRMVN